MIASTLIVFSCLLTIISVVSSMLYWHFHSAESLYFLFLLSTICGYSTHLLISKRKEITKINRWQALLFLGFTVSGFYLRFLQIKDFPIWTDEEFHSGKFLYHPDVIVEAAIINQPPIFYYLLSFALRVLGPSEFSLRFFSAFFGAISIPTFYLLLSKTCKKQASAIFGTLLFLGNVWLDSFSIEGKAYSCGIFFLLIALHSLADLSETMQSKLKFICANSLFLLSLGMQPEIMVVSFSITFAIYFLCTQQGSRAISLGLCVFASVILTLPFHWEVIQQSRAYLYIKEINPQNLPSPEITSIMLQIMEYIRKLLYELIYLFPLVLVGSSKLHKADGRHFIWSTSMLALVFPLLFIPAYALTVNAPFQSRYIILYLPIYIAAITFGIDNLLVWFSGKITEITVIFIAILYMSISMTRPSEKIVENKWKQLFSIFSKEDVQDAMAFVFTADRPGFALIGFLGKDFYSSKTIEKKIALESHWNVYQKFAQSDLLINALDTNRSPSHIYFFQNLYETNSPLSNYKFSVDLDPMFIPVHNYGPDSRLDNVLLRIKNNGNYAMTLEKFLLEIDKQESNLEKKEMVSELLARIEIRKGNCKKANFYFSRLTARPTEFIYRNLTTDLKACQ